MTLPISWASPSGAVMTRPAGISDAGWQAALEGNGWTPAATSTQGTTAPVSPAQAMGLVMQALTAGATIFSMIHGVINEADPVAGTVGAETGASDIPIAEVGPLTSTGAAGIPPINVTPDPNVSEEPTFFEKPANLALVFGGAALLLILVMKK